MERKGVRYGETGEHRQANKPSTVIREAKKKLLQRDQTPETD